MKGTVENLRGSPNPHDFDIKGEDGKTYFAHVGDIEANEKAIYKNPAVILKEGEIVEFGVFVDPRQRAIHVKKI